MSEMSDSNDPCDIKEEQEDDYERTEECDNNNCESLEDRNGMEDVEDSRMHHIFNATDSTTFPLLTNFVGDHNFELVFPPRGNYKSSGEFSSMFNQIFIDINKVLMLQFTLDAPEGGKELVVRAMPVYCDTDYICFPVNRCTLHSGEDDPLNQAHSSDDACFCYNYNHVGHVVKSQMTGAIYTYDRSTRRHSVAVPFPCQPGKNSLDIPYSFTCKTSCSNGMQRRPINLVFTLENQNGKVLGRTAVGVKICSSPKRDRDRLERDSPNKKIRLCQTQIVNRNAPVPCPVSEVEEFREKIRDELRSIYRAKRTFDRSIRSIKNLLDHM